MRVATWNVNSIRSRVDRVTDWLVREDVDVLAMQEIKCKPEQFPLMSFSAAGYEVELNGFNQWNGVAFASRLPMEEVELGFPGVPGFGTAQPDGALPTEARAMGVTVEGVRLWSLYVPNGRELGHPHYYYKLEWLERLTDATKTWLAAHPGRPFAIMGDFNIAPLDSDVWDISVFLNSTHVSVPEREAFAALQAAGLHDVVRDFVPTGFTYWDYKRLRFPRNEGMRIDFILGSQDFTDLVTAAAIHRNERKGTAPSDHVPVVVDLDLDAGDGDDDDRPMIF
jgi:exodeoxyribonuclease-3